MYRIIIVAALALSLVGCHYHHQDDRLIACEGNEENLHFDINPSLETCADVTEYRHLLGM